MRRVEAPGVQSTLRPIIPPAPPAQPPACSWGPGFEAGARDGPPADRPTGPRRSPQSWSPSTSRPGPWSSAPSCFPRVEALDNIRIPTFTNIDAPVPRGVARPGRRSELAPPGSRPATWIRAGELARIASTAAAAFAPGRVAGI